MTIMIYESSEDVSQTISQEWQTKISRQWDVVPAGRYYIQVYGELAGNLTNRAVATRVMIDGVERATHRIIPQIANEYSCFSMMGIIEFPTETSHSILVQYTSGYASQTVSTRRVRMLVTRF